MSTLTDATHDPALRSWVTSANDGATDFPIQNLPYARLRRSGSDEPWRIGVAIGDQVLDLKLAREQCPWTDEALALLAPAAAGAAGLVAGAGALTAATGVAEYAVDVSHPSSESEIQVTASPPCPAIMIALRAFSASVTTFEPPPRIWSASDGTMRLPGPVRLPAPRLYATTRAFGSSVHGTTVALVRSNQVLPGIPWVCG